MTKKELIKTISDFVKLNPKKAVYPNINKYDPNNFIIVRNLFKSNLKLITQDNYDEIFSNKKGQFLSGKEWVKILLDSKNINNYYVNIRHKFIKCNQQRLYEKLFDDLFLIYYHDEKTVLIEATDRNFDINTRKKLEKLRNFLEQKEWGIYFSELQKLMHEQIINFLDWNGNFTYENYSKVLASKFNDVLDKQLSEQYLQFVKKVNLYRNTFSKVKPSENNKNQQLIYDWNNSNILIKKSQAWDLYFQLNNFISIINLILNS